MFPTSTADASWESCKGDTSLRPHLNLGHVDILVDFRIVATLIELGKKLGCYKITLNCTDQMMRFYDGLGFKAEEGNANFLMIRVPKAS